MAAVPNISITFEFEPIVKVLCTAVDCRFNLMNIGIPSERQVACGLKHITIDYDATCKNYEQLKEAQDELAK